MTPDPRPGNTVTITRPGRWTHVIDTAPTATFYTDELRPTS